MKKFLLLLLLVLLLGIALIYWSVSSTDKEFERGQLINIDNVASVNFKDYDSVLIAASFLYEGESIKKLIQGEQYREAWATPIKAPVVFLDTLFGGMRIIKEGGGNQTHSLKLKAPNNIVYTLRSVNKDPQPLIPEFLRALGLENIVVDGISAQHPYGAILVAELAESSQVLHTHPKLVFVPKQEILGDFNDKYGNRLFLLEYESDSEENWTALENIVEILDTDDLQEFKRDNPQAVSVDKHALVRSRLFDFLIGDWDRHTKQWGWAMQKTNNQYVAIPIAADRDNAFFNIEGVIPSLIANKNIEPMLRPFKKDIDYLPGLVYPFDRYFLLNTPESVFIEEAKFLQQKLTDKTIEAALHVWDKAIVELDGKQIVEKIKSRRDHLVQYATEFKKIIDERGKLHEALKGSDDIKLPDELIACFECGSD
ncbi:hypothetical protein [Hwangdonia lutea]|uniref:Uncharacterized protein n=1 Tax=Hwangdonia lutea TaxID=3075823 RepID=A0AA97EKP0_9FLAO|nr:hypothetical protein [Hwangdonia sp. SCSIO 19198]WOD43002.1 hypothetical protein RNZ46_13490 [Hwangdonia sp. SCSIO 19198]